MRSRIDCKKNSRSGVRGVVLGSRLSAIYHRSILLCGPGRWLGWGKEAMSRTSSIWRLYVREILVPDMLARAQPVVFSILSVRAEGC